MQANQPSAPDRAGPLAVAPAESLDFLGRDGMLLPANRMADEGLSKVDLARFGSVHSGDVEITE
jgi:hypothetical protein